MDSWVIATLIFVFVYLVYYIGGRQYLRETFGGQVEPTYPGQEIPVEDPNAKERPYATMPINKLEDYDGVETDVIANQEGGRALGQAAINMKARARAYDWSQLPPNTFTFAGGQQKWIADSTPAPAIQLAQYDTIEGFQVQPDDTAAIEAEEKKILQTYKPKKCSEMTYSIEDTEEMIRQIYKAKGEIPEIHRTENGVYEIIATRPEKEEIVWEDDAAVAAQPARYQMGEAGAARITVPSAAGEMAASLDPFFEPRTSLRPGRTDYTKWTPGLERAFAPTFNEETWY